MAKLAGRVTKYPARVSFLWYATAIFVGSVLLMYPGCLQSGAAPMRWIDALFMATSATCVTGLATRQLEHDFSILGQLVILVLIQLGGIGILTLTMLVTLRVRKRAGLRERLVVMGTIGTRENNDLIWVLMSVVRMVFIIEFIGFVLLAVRNLFDMPWHVALWHALFHSISAFCNAGFSLFHDSLSRYRGDIYVNIVISVLIILGGLGFPVLFDIRECIRNRERSWWEQLSLHTKLMLLGTGVLLLGGAIATLALEWNGVLRQMGWAERILAASFHSVTCRTAGFSTIEVSSLTNATLFLSMLLMMIGAGPCSTAGGFKVPTAAVMVLRAWATFRGHEKIHVFRRTVPEEVVEKAVATAFLFGVVAAAALTLLLVVEQSSIPHDQAGGLFAEAFFEVISALGTVGLSAGLTEHLTSGGKSVLVALMLLGRLGPITVFDALSQVERRSGIEYPADEPLIG